MASRRIPFVKMHGAGNDFVFLTRERTRVPMTPKRVRLLMDRHFGIGGDQLLLLEKAGARPKLTIFNSDGSQAEMCGNGVRAVAYYLTRHQGMKKDFTIDTKAGPIGIGLRGGRILVDMGKPILEGRKIPVKASGEIIDRPFKVAGKTFRIHAVSMGNPHCVIFVKDVAKFPVREIGPLIETHPFFPKRVNVEFVQVLGRDHVKVRVWERGAGETLACGTGACAVAVASIRAGRTGRRVKLDLPGGRLEVEWGQDGRLRMTGPAEVTYSGEFYV